MATQNPSSLIEAIPGWLAPFGGITLLLALIWIIWSTQSVHTLRFRAWRLLHGKTEIHDPDIKRFIDERNALMTFRFLSGLKVRTVESARAFARWLHEHNEDVRAVRSAGPYFDPETLQVKTDALPHRWTKRFFFLGSFMLFLAGIYFGSMVRHDHALLRIISTDTWFGVTSDGFALTNWVGDAQNPMVTIKDCQAGKDKADTLAKVGLENAKVLCELITHPEGAAYLAKSVKDQKGAMFSLAWILAIMCYCLFRKLPQAEAASALNMRLMQRARQLHLPY